MKKYSKYKDSGVEWIGEIPQRWNLIKIKNTCNISNFQISQQELNGKQVIHYSIPNVQETGTGQLEDGDDIDSSKIVVNGGEVLFSKLNPRKGTTCIVKENTQYLQICSGEFITMNPKLNDTKYHWYIVSCSSFIQFIDSQVESVTRSHQRVRPDSFLSSLIPIPPLSEQKQIVAYLDEKTTLVDQIISASEKKIELLKEQRTATINQAVTKGLNPKAKMKDSGVEWIGEIPQKWECRLGTTIGEFSKGKGIKKDEVIDRGNPCVRYGEIYTKYNHKIEEIYSFINDEVSETSIKVNGANILLTGSGELAAEIGKAVVVDLGELYIGGDIIILKTNNDFDPHYLTYQLNAECLRIQRELAAKGEIVVHIYSKNFREMRYCCPPLSEQKQIVAYLDEKTKEIDELISSEQKRIELLKEYRQSLISEVVTGKIKVSKD